MLVAFLGLVWGLCFLSLLGLKLRGYCMTFVFSCKSDGEVSKNGEVTF